MHTEFRKKIILHKGWKRKNFSFDNQGFAMRQRYDAYQMTKTGAQSNPAAVSYDDHAWMDVEVPEDFADRVELDPEAKDYNGYVNRENCWYRRFFYIDPEDAERRILLHLDGVSGESAIYINGAVVARRFSAYLNTVLDITDFVMAGSAANLLAISVNHERMQGWWYQGEGLYREVWLEVTSPVYIAADTIQIVTYETDADRRGNVSVNLEVRARAEKPENMSVSVKILDPEGRQVTEEVKKIHDFCSVSLTVPNPRLWDIYQGNCYTCRIELYRGQELIDAAEQTFGFRTFSFDVENGFILNGRNQKIKGFCFHEDEGNLGWLIQKEVYERRIQNMAAMGANAYRCSHNAPDPILLDLCDHYGILVMDETRRFDSSETGLSEWSALIRRDRNHPSVILWSVGNEEPWQGDSRGFKIADTMTRLAHGLDDTRPVTMAMHNGFFGECAAKAVDVVGVNYNHERLDQIRKEYPDKPILGTEVLALSDDIVEVGNSYPGSEGAYETLEYMENHTWYAGVFCWAGEDYRGEHRNLSFFTDACPLNCNGDRKDGFFRYQARWTDEPVVHLTADWRAEGQNAFEGKPVRTVVVTSNLPKISLFVNGRLAGEKEPDDRQKAVFEVPFEPGELKAEGEFKGKKISDAVFTNGNANAFHVWTEQPSYKADVNDLVPVWVEALDENNHRMSMGSQIFRADCAGPAEIVCTDNADPYCSAFPEKNEMCLYQGKGKIWIRSNGQDGPVTIRISGLLKSGECRILFTEPDDKGNAVYRTSEAGVCINPYLEGWFVTHIFSEKPDIYTYTEDSHYVHWQEKLERTFLLDRRMPFFYDKGGGYVIYCLEPDLPAAAGMIYQKLVFEEITGEAEILVSVRDYSNRILKQFYQRKDDADPGMIKMELTDVSPGSRLIIKLIIKGNHGRCGLTAPVRFEV